MVHITQLLPDTQLYKYTLQRRIGAGSFGAVWLARDNAIAKQYAIKILKPETPVHHRLREAHIGHALVHNNLVRVHQADVIEHGGEEIVIIAMDYLPAGPITNLANPSRFLPLPEVIRLGTDILRGLEYLHEQDFYHNDIKPENVLIGPHHQGMLSDYGIVGISEDGGPVAPPNCYKIHAAPEVVNHNHITAQTDLFQTGLTLFRLLVGLDTLRQKFNALGEQDYYKAICNAELLTVSDFPAYIPPRMRRLVLKAVDPNLDRRFSCALEMRRELERLSFGGYWTVSPSGQFVGHSHGNSFRFEESKKGKNKYDIDTFKKNDRSKIERRISKFCGKNLPSSKSKKQIERFVKAVVEGI